MSVQSAAIQILKEAGKPLHATEIAKLIIEAGLWKSDGKTPEATVSARLYTDIKSNGDKSSFVKVGPQTFALRDPTEIEGDTASVLAPVEKPSKLIPPTRAFPSSIVLRRCLRSSAVKSRCTTRKSPRRRWKKDGW